MNPVLTDLEKGRIMQPSAARMVESLRDTGYTFNTAVADITDNSVAAGATRIAISLELEFDNSPVMMIADNGGGMDAQALEAAMMYGSPQRPSPKSLGKFGMGLKTASTSFCRRLTVISRRDGALSMRQWNLDEVVRTDKWLLLEPTEEQYEQHLNFLDEIAGTDENGTLVIWEDIDRLIRSTTEGSARNQLDKISLQLREHLSGVFHNFMTANDSTPTLEIFVNNEALKTWDPFCRWLNEDGSNRVHIHKLKPFHIQRDNDSQLIGTFYVNIYILPNKSELTAQELELVRYNLNNQGFHVFREGRMIYSGGWPNRIFVKDPHQNLLRVELIFDHELDDYFQIDIKKSRIDFPGDLREKLKIALNPARRSADQRYRAGSPRKSNSKASRLSEQHNKSGNIIGKHHDETTANSKVESVNPETGDAMIRNKHGITKVTIRHDDKQDCLVQTSQSLQDGVLWMPGLAEDNRHAVVLNETHEFYRRFYHPNRENAMLVQAMDSLMWSLAEAELSVLTDSVKRNLVDLRINVSRILRTLAQDLPEEQEEQEEQEGDTDTNSEE